MTRSSGELGCPTPHGHHESTLGHPYFGKNFASNACLLSALDASVVFDFFLAGAGAP